MNENPVERLRNKLSPFLNLVSLLTLEQVKISSENEQLTKLIEQDLKVCAENIADIRKYLDDAHELIPDEKDKKGLDYKVLKAKLDEKLSKLSKEELEKWLAMDKARMKCEKYRQS